MTELCLEDNAGGLMCVGNFSFQRTVSGNLAGGRMCEGSCRGYWFCMAVKQIWLVRHVVVKDVEAYSVCRERIHVEREVCMYSDQLTLPRKCEGRKELSVERDEIGSNSTSRKAGFCRGQMIGGQEAKRRC